MKIPTDWTFDDFLEHCLPPPSALSELYELEIAGGISPETTEWLEGTGMSARERR